MTRSSTTPFDTMDEFIDRVCTATGSKILTHRGSECVISPCPHGECKGDKFAINTQNGCSNCPKCGWRGNGWQLARMLGMEPVGSVKPEQDGKPRWQQDEIDENQAADAELLEHCEEAQQYLASRGISMQAARAYGLGCRFSFDKVAITFPYHRTNGKVAFHKCRSVGSKHMWLSPRVQEMPLPEERPLFGAYKFANLKTWIVTEGEYDALAIYEAGVHGAVSIPFGAATITEDMSRALVARPSVVVAYDADVDGEKGVHRLREKFGREFVRRAYFGEHKDANDALLAGWGKEDFAKAIGNAEIKPPDIVRSAREIACELIADLEAGKFPEPAYTGFPFFDDMQRGIREGELTVVTAHSGEGKTTFLVDLCLRMAQRNEPVCFVSLEQPVGWTVSQLMGMVRNCAVEDMTPDDRQSAHRDLPRNFYIGAEPEDQKLKQVTDALRFCRIVYDVRLAVVDHLDFVIEPEGGEGRYPAACRAVKALHACARDLPMHVVLVCQPTTDSGRTKTTKRREVWLEDIAETRLARQLAANGYVISSDKDTRKTKLYVAKARYGPAREHVTYTFQFDGFRYQEIGYDEGRK